MKLDMDLARAILLQAEAAPPNQFPKINLPDHDADAVAEHVQLLAEAGLLEASIAPSGSGGRRIWKVSVKRLTWEGHQFLENARNDTVWAKTKTVVKEKGGSASFKIIKALLTAVTMQHFGLSGGGG